MGQRGLIHPVCNGPASLFPPRSKIGSARITMLTRLLAMAIAIPLYVNAFTQHHKLFKMCASSPTAPRGWLTPTRSGRSDSTTASGVHRYKRAMKDCLANPHTTAATAAFMVSHHLASRSGKPFRLDEGRPWVADVQARWLSPDSHRLPALNEALFLGDNSSPTN
jgi:hypothetical protein